MAGTFPILAPLKVRMIGIQSYGMPFDHRSPDDAGSNAPPIGPEYAARASLQYFNTRKASIYAGSNEIQRSIMVKLVFLWYQAFAQIGISGS